MMIMITRSTRRAHTSARATDRYQNLMACYLYHPQSFLKISSKSIHKFSSNLANRQTDRQAHKQTQIDATESITSAKLRFGGGNNRSRNRISNYDDNDDDGHD